MVNRVRVVRLDGHYTWRHEPWPGTASTGHVASEKRLYVGHTRPHTIQEALGDGQGAGSTGGQAKSVHTVARSLRKRTRGSKTKPNPHAERKKRHLWDQCTCSSSNGDARRQKWRSRAPDP